ncbi:MULTISPECIES: hypothetical protein [unclassified Nocardia]|uniref:hypothetical protein n=1 Tax=unclassified Nocardia TaxID=2637762 RepID=UPI0024A90D7C|nr:MULTISPECIES: hypothetical protein [unclassified Nocardia]
MIRGKCWRYRPSSRHRFPSHQPWSEELAEPLELAAEPVGKGNWAVVFSFQVPQPTV